MQFLANRELSEKIFGIIRDAEDYLLILSPYISLDDQFREGLFKAHFNNPRLHIMIVFGKNESDIDRSFVAIDREFFMQFPNISIVYIPALHAKYYGNEKMSVVTSLNLLYYSFKNNIEFGVLSKKNLFSLSMSSLFDSSFNKCIELMEEFGYTIFIKRPKYRYKLLIFKDYIDSDVKLDMIDELIGKGAVPKKQISEFQHEKYFKPSLKDGMKTAGDFGKIHAETTFSSKKKTGFCIRCSKTITHNTEKPMCANCYKIWKKYYAPQYPEKYCTTCGKQSTTSMAKPQCHECYKKSRLFPA